MFQSTTLPRLRLLVLVIIITRASVFSQRPAFFILGESQFKGVQVYDVVQDNDHNYWFATNEGLYYYNHYIYQKIECNEAKSNSIFNFVIKPNGVIYCNNLNNQIFKISNKTCSLFYELQPDEISSDISLAVTANNQLLVGAKKVIQISEEGTVIKRINFGNHYLGQPYTDSKNTIYYSIGFSDSLLIINNTTHRKDRLVCKPNTINENAVLKFISFNTQTLAIDVKTKTLFSFNPKTLELIQASDKPIFEPDQSVRLYSADNKLWFAGTLPGVLLADRDITNTKLIFEDYYISDVYKDHEGNILLSTFDKGILVIPDLSIPDVINSFRDDPVTSLLNDSVMGLLMGSSKGLLMTYNKGKIITLTTNGKRPIEHIHSNHSFPHILYDDGFIRAFNKTTKTIEDLTEGSLKDAVIVSNKLVYLGTNIGVKKIECDSKNKFTDSYFANITFRVYSLAFNYFNECLYASTSKGLLCITKSGEKTPVLYNNKSVFPTNLYYYNGKVYGFENKEGILIIEDNTITGCIRPLVEGQLESISKFCIYKNTIIAKTPKGLLQFGMSGEFLKLLNTLQGSYSNRIIDFDIKGDELWVSNINGVQKTNLTALRKKTLPPQAYISEIVVNDSLTNYLGKKQFSNKERKIQFTVSSPTLRDRQNIRYHYKMEGNDFHWSINNYESNKITYNALAPGEYTFFVKSEKQGVFSDVVSYTFTIASPLYSKWWFIFILVGLFLSAVFFIYKWQLNIQQRKSRQINELNASKLTAIQSQMNPHFIFNSLNSIQDLILKGDVEHSYSYITTFSNLVRRTLNYSDKDFIDFEQEIKLLELYLSLEKLRFKKDFSYSIDANKIMDIQIPPMLIQPFIENALVHGLLHKEGEKRLYIKFELKDVLICTIEDNGIGREKAKSIKQRQRAEHESFSVKAIKKRFEILSQVFEGSFGFYYTDLEKNNETTGTLVTLKIPLKHKF